MPSSPDSKEALHQRIQQLEEEKRRLESRLYEYQADEQRFQKLLKSTEEGYFEVDLAGDLTFFNDAACRVLGYPREELLGKNNREYTTSETARRMYQIFTRVYQTGSPAEITDYEIIRKDGGYRILELSAYLIYDESGQPNGFAGVGRDVTKRKRIEEELATSQAKYQQLYREAQQDRQLYQSLLDSSPDAIILLDPHQAVRYINPAFTRLFGWTEESLKNQGVPYIPKARKAWFKGFIQKLMEAGEPVRGKETQVLTHDGRFLDVSISAARYLDGQGNPAGVLIFFRDITQAKRFQWHMHQAQKMESIGTMAGGIAHDFNNLLMGIQGRLSLIRMETDPVGKQRSHLREIENYTEQAAELTQQLLDLTRDADIEVVPRDINALISTQNQLFGRTHKELSIHENLAADLWTAEVDSSRIEQVLLNIYVNAAHAMPDGGDLYVETTNEYFTAARTRPHDLEPGNYIKISITDNGVGMDETVQRRIFEPFFTTKKREQGTGLGLASAYTGIKNHGGFITVYSVKGKGTTFNIYLPASFREAEVKTEALHEPVSGTGTILFVDDEEMIIEVGEEMLHTLGYDVVSVDRGARAVEILKQDPKAIDLVILDLIMPEMNGKETFERLRPVNPDLKILLSSGYSLNGHADRLLQKGCNGFIQKPFNLVELSRKLDNILNQANS